MKMKIYNSTTNYPKFDKPEYKAINATSFKSNDSENEQDTFKVSEKMEETKSLLSDLWENKLGPWIDRIGKLTMDILPDYTAIIYGMNSFGNFLNPPPPPNKNFFAGGYAPNDR
jgi:hypothetical protein